ncbi:hypothetical protein ACLI1A_01110 [Flavobacterium sp. RHBU_3]|uniref:hypothetical protein n=1 Tax=Flavobacterium sp. RHBU_3 TaxID=3391184 RepID=UPI0039852CB3
MKNLNYLLAAALLGTALSANAQINQTPITGNGGQIMMPGSKSNANVQGSMYINEAFLPAKIGESSNSNQMLRYNAYSDYFEISYPQEQTVKSLPKQPGTVITFATGEQYVLINFVKDKAENSGYMQLLGNNAKVKIYKREHIYLQAASKPDNGYGSEKPATYKKDSDEFYVQIGDAPAQYFSSKKSFSKLVPGKSEEILNFIKQNKIDLEKGEDLAKLAEYTASII